MTKRTRRMIPATFLVPVLILGIGSGVFAAEPNSQWMDQMSKTVDQMMSILPQLAEKNPDAALQTMNEMLKVMSQMNAVMSDNAKGMMVQVPTAPVAPTPAPATSTASDPNSGSMQMGSSDPNAGGGMDSMDKMEMGGMM